MREPKWYQYIGVRLKGKGKVSWIETHTEGRGSNQRTYSTEHFDCELYVDQVVAVWGDIEAPEPARLDAGTFTFPFQITIPADCPPTFKTDIGKISYQVYGIVSSQVKQYKIKTPLILNRLIDLNQQPDLLHPVEKSAVKDITTCCCFKSGSVEITCIMPKTGFCVGQEQIPITFECRNGSSREISVRAELALRGEYKASSHTKRSYETIANFPCRLRPSEGDSKSVEFDIPPTIQMPFTGRVITASHAINIWVNHSLDFAFLSLTDADPPISVPITIGNVPFHSQQTAVPGLAPPEGSVQPLATPEPSTVKSQTSAPPKTQSQPLAPVYGLETTI